jgi:histidinol phosphatase-like enzyme (inositol monophosphatase family)
MRFEKELDVARKVAAEAGRLALEHQARGFESEAKADLSPVTTADRANEELICRRLEEAFPEDGVLGEEGARRESASGRRWIIDPIDGTRDFVRGIPTWGVMLALEARGAVVVGACNLPALGELYSAATGIGAYRNDSRIHAAAAKSPDQAVVCLTAFNNLRGQPFAERLIPWFAQFWAVRSMGGCMDAMCVCSGRADAWVEVEAKAWDLAPLKIIAEEAGARFFNFTGESSIYSGNCVITIPSLEAEIRKFLAG